MGEEMNVKLHGFWASPYVKRVELALKVKGIPYEYVEEELCNKSDLLLQYNPVYKKVPVLVHNGKPTAESLVILEYIDETWKNHNSKLLPEDPYLRATFRFWGNYIHQLFETMRPIVAAEAEAQERIIDEVQEKLNILEEGIGNIFPQGKIPVVINGTENMGYLDILMCSVFARHEAVEEGLGLKILDPEKTPLICSWIAALNDLQIVKQIIPPHDNMVILFKNIRQRSFTIPSSS